MFNRMFPYTSFENVNLDWILRKLAKQVPAGLDKVVSYDPQNPTPEEQAQARDNLGLGDLALENSPLPMDKGGTGADNAADARDNLGLGDLAVEDGPLPLSLGGTGADNAIDAVNNLGLGNVLTSIANLQNSRIYTPEDFGAVGDGVNDDTAAIQDMFDTVRAGIVAFRANHLYKVTDTIIIHGGYGSITVLLGALRFTGAGTDEQAVIEIRKDTTPGNNTKYGAGGVNIYGGFIWCNTNIGVGIRNYDCFDTTIIGTKITSYRNIGIDNARNDDLTNTDSTQMIIADCVINNYNYGLQQGHPVGTAIRMVHPDNLISNCNCNDCAIAVELYRGGNYFSNCHFTIHSNAPTSNADMLYDFIRINPPASANETNTFNACYFNGYRMRWLIACGYDDANGIFVPVSSTMVTRILNCNLILGAHSVNTECGIFGEGIGMTQIENLNIRHTGTERIYGFMPVGSTGARIMRSKYTVDSSINATADPWDVVNFTSNPKLVCDSDNVLPAGTARRIARVYANASFFGHEKIKIETPAYEKEVSLFYRNNPVLWVGRIETLQSTTSNPDLQIYIQRSSTTGYINFNNGTTQGMAFRYFDIYIYNNTGSDYANQLYVSCKGESFPLLQIATVSDLNGTADKADITTDSAFKLATAV